MSNFILRLEVTYLSGIPDTERKWIKTIEYLKEESVDSYNNLRRMRENE